MYINQNNVYNIMGDKVETELNNTVSVLGNYNSIPTSINSDVTLVTMVSGLTVTKTADKPIWADGILTYTIIVDNKTQNTYTTPVITDMLDINLIEFVNDSVTIDGVTSSAYTYDSESGKLEITLTDIDVNNSKTVTFKVKKKS